jgi:hypothetical protein
MEDNTIYIYNTNDCINMSNFSFISEGSTSAL